MKTFVWNVTGHNREGQLVTGDVVLAESYDKALEEARKIAQKMEGEISDIKLIGQVTGVSPSLHLGEVLQLQSGELQKANLRHVVVQASVQGQKPQS